MSNFTDPAILFFVFGILAGSLKSNLEIPPPISRFLSLYLLMALGLKGGFALAQSGLTPGVLVDLGAALAMAFSVPLIGYMVLRRFLSGFDAAAVAATYGSVSAVTFITASQYLDNLGVAFGGHMAAAMALMESPAIVFAVFMANHVRRRMNSRAGTNLAERGEKSLLGSNPPLGKILHEALTDGAQLLLLGAMLIGLMTGEAGQSAMKPFSVDLFKGMLAFFLLDIAHDRHHWCHRAAHTHDFGGGLVVVRVPLGVVCVWRFLDPHRRQDVVGSRPGARSRRQPSAEVVAQSFACQPELRW